MFIAPLFAADLFLTTLSSNLLFYNHTEGIKAMLLATSKLLQRLMFSASILTISGTAFADSHTSWSSGDVNRATSSLSIDQLSFCFQISIDVAEANGFTDALNVAVANEEDLFRLWSLSNQVTVERTRDMWDTQKASGRLAIIMLSQEDSARFVDRVVECSDLVTSAIQAIQELNR